MIPNPYQTSHSPPQPANDFPKQKRFCTLRVITGQMVRVMTAMCFLMLLGSLVKDEPTGVGVFGCLTGFFIVLSAATIPRD
ncbi:hypothetical protein LOC71_20470 [Rhodopirellula sp. JC740]|uniref:Uncharacterized protein n=1 Tax=Rhodopirellula halodulae TaxID=2894198 RepID=A0ABS8NM50_9BACT|nr:hypothetical protein [Rhodopirellula sp. JC740]